MTTRGTRPAHVDPAELKAWSDEIKAARRAYYLSTEETRTEASRPWMECQTCGRKTKRPTCASCRKEKK